MPLGFVVLKAGVQRPEADIIQEVLQMVRDQIGPVASFKKAAVVQRLPKTRSGKVLRSTIKKIADHEAYEIPSTIDDPKILSEISDILDSI
jgi:propionyl-CoA synthetase